MTGRVGCCIATSGPGATNLATGLADANLDSVPVVAITGQVRAACGRNDISGTDWTMAHMLNANLAHREVGAQLGQLS